MGKRCPYFIPFCSRSQALSGILHLCLLVRLSPKGFQTQPGATSQIHLHQGAKVELGAPFQRFTGKIGKLSYRWMYGKQTVMKTPDMSKVKWSGAQKANCKRFREAIAYARAAMAEPKVRAYYQKVAKKANRPPFRVAVSDFCAGKNLLERR